MPRNHENGNCQDEAGAAGREKEARGKDTVQAVAVQMGISPFELEANRRQLCEWIERVCDEGATDLIVFPELANSGYVRPRDRAFGREYLKTAETIPGPTTERVGVIARKRRVAIVVGINEADPTVPGVLYNSAAVIDESGEVIGVHRKLHIPGEEKHYFRGGDSIEVFRLACGVIGVNICMDAFFPELARIQCLQGAEILVMPFNTTQYCDHPATIEYLAAVRAIENKCFAAASNRVGVDGPNDFNGLSAIADPYGRILAKVGKDEVALRAELRSDVLYEERAFHPVFTDRREELYGPIVKRVGSEARWRRERISGRQAVPAQEEREEAVS